MHIDVHTYTSIVRTFTVFALSHVLDVQDTLGGWLREVLADGHAILIYEGADGLHEGETHIDDEVSLPLPGECTRLRVYQIGSERCRVA